MHKFLRRNKLRSVLSNSLQLHGLQHARLPVHHQLPELAHQTHCPSSWWCHPAISSSIVPFCLQFFPASGSFPMSQLLASGGRSTGASASASFLPMNIQCWFSLGWTGWILQSKGLSSVFSKLQFKSINSSTLSFLLVQLSYPYKTIGKTIAFTRGTFVSKVMSLLFNMLCRFVIAFLPRSNFF